MKAKLEAYARRNNLPAPMIETVAIKNQKTFISKVAIKGKTYVGEKCQKKEEAEASAASVAMMCIAGATALPPELMNKQLQELKVMYEDMIGYTESMLQQSKNCLRLIKLCNNFSQFEETCEDLVGAILIHKEELIRDLRFVEAKIVARARASFDAL